MGYAVVSKEKLNVSNKKDVHNKRKRNKYILYTILICSILLNIYQFVGGFLGRV